MSYLERMAGRVKFLAEVLRLERGLSRAAADIKAFAQRNAYIKEESCGNSDGGGHLHMWLGILPIPRETAL